MESRQQASSGTPRQRSIDSDRFERALTEPMSVAFTGPEIADVTNDGSTYGVELGGGVCECRDYEFRGDAIVCKHVIRGALAALFEREQRNTELVARVAAFAREHGCPFGNECGGPAAPGRYPCPECVRGVGGDDWAVWCALIRDTTGERTQRASSEQRVVADGGRSRPTRSEPADFGGGEASGMDKLGDFDDVDGEENTDDGSDDAPAIEDVGDHRCRCTGCGREGVKDLDREPVILHERDCPNAEADR